MKSMTNWRFIFAATVGESNSASKTLDPIECWAIPMRSSTEIAWMLRRDVSWRTLKMVKCRSSPVNHELVVGFGQSEEGLKQHASLYFWLKRILWGMGRAVSMMSRWLLVRYLIS